MKAQYIIPLLSFALATANIAKAEETFTIKEDNKRLYYAEGDNAQSSYTVQEAIARAIDANPDLDAAYLQIKSANYDKKSAYGAMLPFVTSSASVSQLSGSAWASLPPTYAVREVDVDKLAVQWQVAAIQPIFPFYNLLSQAKIARLSEDSAKLQFENATLQMTNAVQTTFIEYLRFDALINTTNSAIRRAEEQLNTTKVSYELGLRPRLDVLQAEVDLATLENNLIQVKNQKEIVRAALQSMLALPITQETEFVGSLQDLPKLELSFEECLNKAMEQRPELKLGRLTVSMAETGKTIARASYFPTLNLQAAYAVTGRGKEEAEDANVFSIGLAAEWHIFTGLARYNAVQKAGVGISQARYALMSEMDSIANEVKAQYLNSNEAQERIQVTAKAVEKARENYNAALTSYELGVGTNLDVMLAQVGLANEESNHTSALADYFLAISRLYTSMGETYLFEL